MTSLSRPGTRSGIHIQKIQKGAAIASWLLFLSSAAAATHEVRLSDAPPYMSPLELDIRAGDTVVWRNAGPQMVHTVTDEAMILFSGDITVGKEWSYTFKQPGTYNHICYRHHFMRGTITVRDAEGRTVAPPEFPYQVAFREFVVPTLHAVPRMIIPSRVDGTLWFTEGGGDFYGFENIPAQNKVAQIDEHGRIVEYATPTLDKDGSGIAVDSLVMDPAGVVWFTERLSNRIGRLDRSGRITEFPVPTPNASALGIDLDSRGNVWFAERYGHRIGRMTPAGEFQEFALPEDNAEPRTVFIDRDGRIWYTARTANEIGYLDPRSGRIVRLKIPTANARPTGVCQTSDGTIYFVEMVGNKIGRVQGQQITEFPLPTKFASPFKIVADREDRLWFTEVFGNAIGRFDPRTGRIEEYKLPTQDARPGGITIDRNGRVWFTEQLGNKVGYLDPARLPAPAATGAAPAAPAATGAAPAAPRADRTAGIDVNAIALKSFPVPTRGGGPGNDLVEDPQGWLWFNEIYGNRIGAFHPGTAEFREYVLPSAFSMPVGLARAADGSLWVPQFRANRLARLDPRSGQVREYPLPTDAALPSAVAIDEHGEVWITELSANRIARFDVEREVFIEYVLPREDSSPLHVIADRRGALWISASEERGNYLARFDLARKRFDAFDLPTKECSPTGLLFDGDRIWVAEGIGKLACFTPRTATWEEFVIPVRDAEPMRLARDRAHRIWITDGGGVGGVGGNRVIAFDPRTRSFALIPMPTPGAKPRGILAAADGTIWFTQQNANLLSVLTVPVQGG